MSDDRLTTGIPTLDEITGGGMVKGSLVVIAGPPGSGKTILAQQMAFANAREDGRVIYYTTLSEPHTKLIRHLEPFGFFDASALGSRLEFNHLNSDVENGAFEEAAAEIIRRSFETRPRMIVIDSIRALHSSGDGNKFRKAVYDLATLVSHTDALLVFVGEYLPEEVGVEPEFAVADAIAYLRNESLGSSDRRTLHVLKLRGSNYIEGEHRFEIGPEGLIVYPRLESLPLGESGHAEGRVSTGVKKLDDMMGGGWPRTSATLVAGPSGVGKTCLGLNFLHEGVTQKEKCAFISFQETQSQLLTKARGFNMDLQKYCDSGQLEIVFLEPIELSIDGSAARVREMLTRLQPTRVVVDSISEIEHAAAGLHRHADFLWAFVEMLRRAGATSLLTNETPAFFGPAFELAGGLSYVFDNVLLMRYTELQSEIHRALTVVKMRESDHVKTLVEFDVGKRGIEIKGDFAGMSGVLTGNPVPTEQRFKDFFGR